MGILPLTYPAGALFDNYNLPKVTLVIAVVAVAGSLRLARIALGSTAQKLPLIAAPAALMAGATTLAWIFTDYRTWSVLGFYTRYGGVLPYLAVFLFAVLLADAFAGSPRPVLIAMVLGAAGVGIGALIQMLFFGFSIGEVSQTAYVTSTIGHSNFLGGYLGIALSVSFALWLGEGRLARLGMITTIPIFCGLLFTVSQGGWLAGLAGVSVVLGIRLRAWRRWAKPTGIALGSAAVFAGVIAVVFTMLLPHAYARVPSFLQTTTTRGLLWEHAITLGLERPIFGWGPNVFAIEGPLHRSVEDALFQNYTQGDDPHSVPLALFANLGLVGVAAFAFVLIWAFRRAARSGGNPALVLPVIGGLVAYVAQAMVSIDEISIRFNLWVLVALAACLAPTDPSAEDKVRTDSGPGKTIIAGATVLLGIVAAYAAITSLTTADFHIKQGLRAFDRGLTEPARAEFQKGLALREDTAYRRVYGRALGQFAFQQGPDAQPLIDEMNDVFSYLEEFPDPQTLALQGQLLDQWSVFEPDALEQALLVFRRVRELDPYNPNVARDTADVLMNLGRDDEAERTLAPYERLLIEEFPEYSSRYGEFWASLAIARARQGELESARTTLARAGSSGGCRFLIASFLLQPDSPARPPGVLGLVCPSSLLRLVQEDDRSGRESGAERAT